MVHDHFHFRDARPNKDLVLSESHRVLGRLVRYLAKFQLDGIRFLYKNFESNHACILNDESGLGKTAVVAGFLSAILPSDNSKRCLIIAKNEQVIGWRFHLDILTKLHVRQVTNEKDVEGDGNVFIATWEMLRKFPNLTKTVFNCVILDDRGDLTTSKFYLNFLLKHFENRISLIIASSDVTLDIKQLHSFLRLCGRLDGKYQKLKVFEEKFSLPKPEGNFAKDKALLEAYFQRRERVINHCRDFRLRRYRHQFEDILPLVHSSTHEKSIQEWLEKELSKSSSLSSGSLKIISSSSEKNTEELFQTYFDSKTEKLLNEEVQKINETAKNIDGDKDKSIYDTEDMSPLLFESDSDEIPLSPPKKFNENDMNIVEDRVLRPKAKKPVVCETRNVRSSMKSTKEDKSVAASPSDKTQKDKRKSRTSQNKNLAQRTLRSYDRKTRRTKSCPSSRDAIIEVFRMVERADKKTRRKVYKRKSVPLTKQEAQAVVLDVSSDSENEIGATDKLEYHPDPETKVTLETGVGNASPGSNYNFNIDLLSKTLAPDSSEIQIYSPEDQIVILSSSTECSEDVVQPKTYIAPKTAGQTGKISPSPDIFENCEEYDFLCSQKNKSSHPGIRLLHRKVHKTLEKRKSASCLQQLEDNFLPNNKSDNISNNFLVKDCGGFTDFFTNMVQIHSTNINKQNGGNDTHFNKITKYLSSQSFDSTQSNRPDTTTKDAEYYLKTPTRGSSSVSQKDSPQRSKKSPKSQRLTPITPNGLTKWLIKKTPENDPGKQQTGASKTSKRKRLDLWFKD